MLIVLGFYCLVLMNRTFVGSVLRSKNHENFRISFLFGGILFPLLVYLMNYIVIFYF